MTQRLVLVPVAALLFFFLAPTGSEWSCSASHAHCSKDLVTPAGVMIPSQMLAVGPASLVLLSLRYAQERKAGAKLAGIAWLTVWSALLISAMLSTYLTVLVLEAI